MKRALKRDIIAPLNLLEEIVIPDLRDLKAKLRSFRPPLQIVSDFDSTLSKYKFNDKESGTTRIISKSLPSHLSSSILELFHKYYPIETSSEYSLHEKATHLAKWWETEQQLIVQGSFHRKSIPELLDNSGLYLRHGIDQLFELSDSHKIPFTVISAGIGNVIEEAFSRVTHKVPAIISNFMEFHETGEIASFSRPLIHSHNKHEHFQVTGTVNVILLGDIPSDTYFVDKSQFNALCIGFYNNPKHYEYSEYLSSYDILIKNDGNLSVVLSVLGRVLSAPLSPSASTMLEELGL